MEYFGCDINGRNKNVEMSKVDVISAAHGVQAWPVVLGGWTIQLPYILSLTT